MQRKLSLKLFFVLCLFFISVNAQNQELKNSFDRINSLFRSYNISSMDKDWRTIYKNVKMTYKHPNIIISFDSSF